MSQQRNCVVCRLLHPVHLLSKRSMRSLLIRTGARAEERRQYESVSEVRFPETRRQVETDDGRQKPNERGQGQNRLGCRAAQAISEL